MASKTTRVIAASSAYIDPSDCDSTVSYKVVVSRYLWGSVQLSDCNRKVDWFFGDHKTSLPKIDKAIEMLQAFRVEFQAAQKSHNRKKPKK